MKQKRFLPSYRNIYVENDHSLSNLVFYYYIDLKLA